MFFHKRGNVHSPDDDLRYPRSKGVVFLRRALRPWWLAFVFYLSNVTFNLITLLFNQGPVALLNITALLQALLFTQIFLLLRSQPWITIPIFALVALCVLLGLWAHRDQENEQKILLERQQAEALQKQHKLEAYLKEQFETSTGISVKSEKAVFFLPFDLPALYVKRKITTDRLIDFLLNNQTFVESTVVLHGIGGLGKTLLARAICDDPAIRKVFSSGILWATVGQNSVPDALHPRISEIQRNWISALGSDESSISNETMGKVKLRGLIGDRPMLLVLDDVWQQRDIELLKVGGPNCRILITTRDQAVDINATILELDVMSLEESRDLLKAASRGKLADNHLAYEVVEHLGHLPLAIDIVSRLLADGIKWEDIKDALRVSVQQVAYGDRTLATVVASVSFLGQYELQRYYELVIFPKDEAIPKNLVTRLWKHTGMNVFEANLLLIKFRQRALLQANDMLHDILYDYLESCVGSDKQRELQRRLIDTLGGAEAWQNFPDDDAFYIWRRIGYHLSMAEWKPALHELLTNGEYLITKMKKVGVREVASDFSYLPHDDRLQLVAKALQLGTQILAHDPYQLRNQLYGRLGTLSDMHNLPAEVGPSIRLVSATLTRPDAVALSTFQGHRGSVFSCVFSPDEQQVLSASADSSLRIWDIKTGKTLLTLEGHSGAVNDCLFLPNGQRIISASDDATLRIWDISRKQTIKILQDHGDRVTGCVLSPGGDVLLSASTDKSIRLWDVNEWKTRSILIGHETGVNCCAFHPEGHIIASGANDGTIRLWNVTTGQTIGILEGHTEGVLSCNFHPRGNLLVSGSEDKTVRLWDTTNGKLIHILEGHTDFVRSCTFSRDGMHVLSASSDYRLRIWNTETGNLERILGTHLSWVNKCCFNRDGNYVLSASYDGSLRIWNYADGTIVQEFSGDIGYLRDCVFSPNGEFVLAAQNDGSFLLWEATRHTALREFKYNGGHARSCAFSPDGKLIASASSDATVRIWDFQTGNILLTLQGHQGDVYECAFSPDGAFILSASQDKTLRLWDASTGELRHVFTGHNGIVRGCTFSPDGKLILSSSWDYTMYLWDIATGEIIQTFEGHGNHVRGCTFSPDGKYVLSASYDTTLRLWNRENGECIAIFEGHTSWIFDCAFTPDGLFCISAADDCMLKLWKVDTREEIASWTADAPLTCCSIHHDGRHIACGDSLGNLHLLQLIHLRQKSNK